LSLRIVNIIASTRVRGSIDIEKLSQEMPNVQYNPELFPGLVYRVKQRPTIIMFASGKISSHGAKSEKEAKEAIVNTLKQIEELHCIIGSSKMENIRIENVVGLADLGYEIDLEKVAQNLRSAIYEPEQFPGLLYKPSHNSLSCTIFSTGKMMIVGGKSESQIKRTFEQTASLIQRLLK
jgi:transcription initiation factor TFIID TATA-box-binding protein